MNMNGKRQTIVAQAHINAARKCRYQQECGTPEKGDALWATFSEGLYVYGPPAP